MISYTEELIAFIHANQHISREDLAAKISATFNINMSRTTLRSYCGRKQIKSTYAYKNGTDTRFKPGLIPWNKGLKGVNGVSPACFKKGNRPKTWLPVGSERVGKSNVLRVKIAEPHTWQSKHSLIWEQHHQQKVPADHVVIFLDSNDRNFAIENLKLISKRTMIIMAKQKGHTLPADHKEAFINVLLIEQKIRDFAGHCNLLFNSHLK